MSEQPSTAAGSGELERPFSGGFVAGTPVYTDKGPLPVERIQVGDFVLSRCEASGEQSYQRVSRTFRTEEQEIRAIAAEGGLNPDESDFLVEYLFAAPEQPIWVNNHGWLPVKKLFECHQYYDIDQWSFARADGRQATFFPELDTVGYPLFEANQACFLEELSTLGDPSLVAGRFSARFRNDARLSLVSDPLLGSKAVFVKMQGGDEEPGFILIFNGDRYGDNYDPAERGPFNTLESVRAVYHGARPIGDFVDGRSHGPNLFKATVFNIEVENFHTCFIGDLGLLVRTA
jgi:hypothetical protein